MVPAATDRQRRITLPPVPESAKVAREFTAALLRKWELDALISDAVLIATELVTNAISHASQPAGDGPGGPAEQAGRAEPGAWAVAGRAGHSAWAAETRRAEPGPPVELTWSYQVNRLICVVTDRALDPPVMSPADTDAESGYGLQIVGALAVAWGWTMLGTGEKAVWAALSLP